MPYIPLEEHLPGITGLLEYDQEAAQPIRELTQILLRGPSTLTEGERELIATVVSNGNQCRFCTSAHTAAADILLGDNETSESVKENISTAPVSDKMKALLTIASMARENGKAVTKEAIDKAKNEGATDIEIHDTVLIAALFCLYNRYVDGLATVTPTNPHFYKGLAERLRDHGYNRLAQGYDHLKKDKSLAQ
ncbi:MAG: carboxymuconolactone decarboxylase family protein [Ginsengibacter sp.]